MMIWSEVSVFLFRGGHPTHNIRSIFGDAICSSELLVDEFDSHCSCACCPQAPSPDGAMGTAFSLTSSPECAMCSDRQAAPRDRAACERRPPAKPSVIFRETPTPASRETRAPRHPSRTPPPPGRRRRLSERVPDRQLRRLLGGLERRPDDRQTDAAARRARAHLYIYIHIYIYIYMYICIFIFIY